MTDRKRREDRLQLKGKEILEIHPVIVGGNPDDPSNKALLTREEHIKAVVYWNKVIRRLRGQLPNSTP